MASTTAPSDNFSQSGQAGAGLGQAVVLKQGEVAVLERAKDDGRRVDTLHDHLADGLGDAEKFVGPDAPAEAGVAAVAAAGPLDKRLAGFEHKAGGDI